MTVSNDTTLTARFLAAGSDAYADGLEDGYEMYYFNTLSNTPQSDPGGDGFDIATDILRGYHPNTFNQIVEGGISRRRSGTTLVVVDTNLVRVTATSEPFGLYSDFQILTRGTNFNFPAEPSFGGYTLTGLVLGNDRVEEGNGFSSG